jgi:hypothetical protein
MTVQLCQEISVLEDAVINLTEGASDERRSAIWALQALLERKEAQLAEFEAQMIEDGYACNQNMVA